MTRIVLAMALCLALAPGASAQDMGMGDLRNRPKVPATAPATQAEITQLWTEVSGLTPLEAGQLLDRVAALAASKNASVGSLSAQASELLRHYGVFKTAHERAANGQGVDLEALSAQVLDGTPSADISHLSRVAAGYFALHHQYSQLSQVRFLASITTDPQSAETYAARAATYEANILTIVDQLKGQLAHQTAR